jgi:hypothetical protein
MTIFGFYYDTESEDWVFKGKVRSHYKEVCNILFLDEEPYGLYTIGKDRHLIKYTDIAAKYLHHQYLLQHDFILFLTVKKSSIFLRGIE